MTQRRRLLKPLSAGILTLFAIAAYAVVQISAQHSPYRDRPAITNASVTSDESVRQAALLQAWGLYRSINGTSVLGRGSIFKLTYMDGSSENASVLCTIGTGCIVIVPGSQQPSSGSGGGNGGGSSGPGGGGAGSGSGPGPTPLDPPGGGSGGGGFPCDVVIVDPFTCILIQGIEPSDKDSEV